MLHVLREYGRLVSATGCGGREGHMDSAPRTRRDDLLAQLRRRPSGMTSGELAEALGVDASTIRRDLARLTGSDLGLQRRGRRYTLDFHRAQRTLRLVA